MACDLPQQCGDFNYELIYLIYQCTCSQ